MTSRVKGELDVLRVSTGDASRPGDRQSIDTLRELAASLGARWHEVQHEVQDDDPARAVAAFAREHQITQIVIGASRRSRWQQLAGGGSNVQRIIREAGAFGIDVHVIARRELPSAGAPAASDSRSATRRSPPSSGGD